jgi:hypothetical protein
MPTLSTKDREALAELNRFLDSWIDRLDEGSAVRSAFRRMERAGAFLLGPVSLDAERSRRRSRRRDADVAQV